MVTAPSWLILEIKFFNVFWKKMSCLYWQFPFCTMECHSISSQSHTFGDQYTQASIYFKQIQLNVSSLVTVSRAAASCPQDFFNCVGTFSAQIYGGAAVLVDPWLMEDRGLRIKVSSLFPTGGQSTHTFHKSP